MARGSDQAKTAATTGQNLANTYSGNAGQLFNTLAPVLQSEVAHPPGFTPPDLAAMDTAAQESAGGSMAGAVGQGGLLAARRSGRAREQRRRIWVAPRLRPGWRTLQSVRSSASLG
jgi:hypothetical protein